MKNKNYLGFLTLILVFFMFSCDKQEITRQENAEASFNLKGSLVCGEVYETDLVAGKNLVVGKVRVEPGLDYLDISYIIESGAWWLKEVHLAVYPKYENIPQTRTGNPQIGLFPYKNYFEPVVKTHTIRVPAPGDNYVIAAHAVVLGNSNWVPVIEEFNSLLPESATLTVKYPTSGSTSYFTSIVTNGGLLDGTYEAWCIDTDNTIYQNTSYTVKVYSSVDEDFATLGLVDYPENMPLVNYILNQNYVGKQADGLGTITYGDVQRAIWELVEENPSTSGLGPWTQAKVNWIKAEAIAKGTDFVPDCGNVIAVILVPVGLDGTPLTVQITIAQITIIEFPVECGPPTSFDMDETAWAAGLNFKGRSWAMYFPYCK
jgi:hypothetical protein